MATDAKKRMTIEEANKRSFRKAVEKYKREAGDLFERHPREDCDDKMPDDWLNGDELVSHLESICKLLKGDEQCPVRPFDADCRRWLATALTLDENIWYEKWTDDCENSPALQFLGESYETICRNAIVATFYDCCIHAAILAQQKSVPALRQRFVAVIAELEMASLGENDAFYVCTRQDAERIVEHFERGCSMLWSEMRVQDEEKRLAGEAGPDVKLGEYAQTIVKSCNFGTGRLTFLNGRTYSIPPGAKKARETLEKLLGTSDRDGYERLERNWHSRFVRKDANGRLNLDSDLTKLRYHIYDKPVAKGRKGTGRFRLEDRMDKDAINRLKRQHK